MRRDKEEEVSFSYMIEVELGSSDNGRFLC
jgi:hypothetical protein